MSVTPSLVSGTKAKFGVGSALAAISAAIFGPAALASFDQPAVSRILTNVILPLSLISLATSSNSGASCVQAMVSGAPPAANLRKRSSSARQSWRPSTTSAPRQTRATASPSSGIVSSQEQIRILRGRSAIGLTNLFACPRVLQAKCRLIGGGAGAGGASGAGAWCVLCRYGGAGRCARRPRATGNRHHHRLAGFDRGQSWAGGRRAAGVAKRNKRGRNAAVAGVRRHDPHGLDERLRARLEPAGHRAGGGRLHRRHVRPGGGDFPPPFHGRHRCLAGARLR